MVQRFIEFFLPAVGFAVMRFGQQQLGRAPVFGIFDDVADSSERAVFLRTPSVN